MKRWMATMLLFVAPITLADDVAEAFSAYIRGDYIVAFSAYQRAANRGNAGAQYNLGLMFLNGQGTNPDPRQAANWFQRAADQGSAAAQRKLGMMYRDGLGVRKSQTEAFSLFEAAAMKRDSEAQFFLGIAFRDGHGIVQDFVRAHMWLNISSASNNDARNLSAEFRDQLAIKMTPQQIAEAQRMARECLNSSYRKCN